MSRIRRNAALRSSVLDAVYPVGSVYITVGATLPASILTIGTWEQLSTGKTLWNVNPSETTPGTDIAAGLPNITGTFKSMYGKLHSGTGAFVTKDEKHMYATPVVVQGLKQLIFLPNDPRTSTVIPQRFSLRLLLSLCGNVPHNLA